MGMGDVYAILRSEFEMGQAEVDGYTLDQIGLWVYQAQKRISDRARVHAAYITDGVGRLLGVIKG